MTVLAVSPHLDDAVFSAGGALATAAAAGHTVVVATVFTRSVPDPTGFALACQTDKGIGPETDYMALRRDEDAAACERIGAGTRWLDLPEAPHRGYDSAESLFDGVRGSDAEFWRTVCDRLTPIVDEYDPDVVLSCQGLGRHVDHLQTIHAVIALTKANPELTSWWRDVPYVLREPDAMLAPRLPSGLQEVGLPLSVEALTVKLDGCSAYASQVPYQFGRDVGIDVDSDSDAPDDPLHDHAMRQRLTAFAQSEGARFGFKRPGECFATGHPEAWDRLWEAVPAPR